MISQYMMGLFVGTVIGVVISGYIFQRALKSVNANFRKLIEENEQELKELTGDSNGN